MGPKNGIGEPIQGLFNDFVDGVLYAGEVTAKRFRLRKVENGFSGNVHFNKFPVKIIFETSSLFEEKPASIVLKVDQRNSKEKYEVVLFAVEVKKESAVFIGDSTLFGSLKVELFLWST